MIRLEHVSKIYKTGDIETTALKDVDVTIQDGAFVVILGPSGSGKSTLLNVISGLDTVTSGTITFDDIVLTDLTPEQMTAFRRDHLGFIFQQYNLLQNLTVYENIQIGADLTDDPLKDGQVLEQIILLEDEAEMVTSERRHLFRGEVGQDDVVERDRTGCDRVETTDDV